MMTLLPLVLALAAGRPAAAYTEIITEGEVADFYRRNQDIKKKQDKYQEAIKKREEQRQADPNIDERALENPMNDPEVQAKNAELAAADPNSYMQDLIAEYLEEKGQIVEDNIWMAAEVKAIPAVRPFLRDYLRKIYWSGHAAGDDTGAYVAFIRKSLESKDGWQAFPREIIGEVPPNAAATYTTGVRLVTFKPGVEKNQPVREHEWLHWWDDMNGSMDGQRGHESQVEPYCYDNMGRLYT